MGTPYIKRRVMVPLSTTTVRYSHLHLALRGEVEREGPALIRSHVESILHIKQWIQVRFRLMFKSNSPSRRGFDVREDDDGLYLRVDMPGLGKEDVQVYVEQNALVMKGEVQEKEEEDDDEASGQNYSSRIDLPPELYKVEEIKAEMKNGVLKIVVPKIREGERKDVFHFTVE